MSSEIDADSRFAAAIFATLRMNAASEAGGIVRRLAAKLDTSERSLRRRSLETFGYGPKTLHRILRLQEFMASARRSCSLSLAELALENGFTDQAHLNREVQSLCSMSAGEFVRQLLAQSPDEA
jgi:AraC-like DNA-binding protein